MSGPLLFHCHDTAVKSAELWRVVLVGASSFLLNRFLHLMCYHSTSCDVVNTVVIFIWPVGLSDLRQADHTLWVYQFQRKRDLTLRIIYKRSVRTISCSMNSQIYLYYSWHPITKRLINRNRMVCCAEGTKPSTSLRLGWKYWVSLRKKL